MELSYLEKCQINLSDTEATFNEHADDMDPMERAEWEADIAEMKLELKRAEGV